MFLGMAEMRVVIILMLTGVQLMIDLILVVFTMKCQLFNNRVTVGFRNDSAKFHLFVDFRLKKFDFIYDEDISILGR